MPEWLRMGGYGAYVWPAYILGLSGMIGMLWLGLRRLRRARRQLAELENSRGG